MRILVAIPHFFEPADDSENRSRQAAARGERIGALSDTIAALLQTFGSRTTFGLDHFNRAAWQCAPSQRHEIDVVVCTTGGRHLLGEIGRLGELVHHEATQADPLRLGFAAHRLLRARGGAYDYSCYVEDDIVITDPLFFRKRALFDRLFGPKALLQPNRYELRRHPPLLKLYVDYHIRPSLTASWQNIAECPQLHLPFLDETVRVERTAYPSAGSFFLNAEQLAIWTREPDEDVAYMSALDSAATLSIMKRFRIYKPVLDQAGFLEVMHASRRWIDGIETQARLVARHQPFAPDRFAPE